MMSNFQLAASFIALSVVPSKQSTRYVASAQTDWTSPRGGKGKGGRGGGRGSNRGRGRGGTDRQNRGGLGGRGGSGGGGRGRSNTKTGYYTDEEWSALSREQRDSILEARGTKRSVAKVETEANLNQRKLISLMVEELPLLPEEQAMNLGGNVVSII